MNEATIPLLLLIVWLIAILWYAAVEDRRYATWLDAQTERLSATPPVGSASDRQADLRTTAVDGLGSRPATADPDTEGLAI